MDHTTNPVQRHTLGMLLIGAITWATYILFINVVDYLNIASIEVAILTGIPLSWVLNYASNSSFNFRQSFSIKRFVSFCLISGIGWMVYFGSLLLLVNTTNIPTFWATIISIAPKTVFNVITQQGITFGWLGQHEHSHLTKVIPNYDWNAFFNGNRIQKWWKHEIYMTIRSWHKEIQPYKIADIGCGSSPILSLLTGTEKIGIEPDLDKVFFMLEQDGSSDYRVGVGEDTKLKDNYYDFTLCIEVLEHHSKPHSLIKELSRITRMSGYVVIATPDFATPAWNIIEVIYGLLMKNGYHGEHNTKFTESSVIALAYAYDLKHIETKSVLSADKIMLFKKVFDC